MHKTKLAQRTVLLLALAGITSIISLSYFVFSDVSAKNSEILEASISSMDFQLYQNQPDSEKINLIIQKSKERSSNDSEIVFFTLENLILSYDEITPQTLKTLITKVDFNNQINLSELEKTISTIKPNQKISSKILVNSLYATLYNDSMFHGSELDLNAIANELFNKFEKINHNEKFDESKIDFTKDISV